MADNTFTLSFQSDAIAAGTGETFYIGLEESSKCVLESVSVVPQTTVALDATDYHTVTAKKGATAVASYDTSATASTAGSRRALTISGAGTDLEFDQDNALVIVLTHAGTGAAFDGIVSAKFRKTRG